MKIVFAVLLCLVFTNGFAQLKKNESLHLADTTMWEEGAIIKADGSQVSGILRFNDQIGTLSFSDGVEEFTFSPNKLVGFVLTDKELGKKRYFYVLENFNKKLKANKKDFYELLFDFKDFTIWSMVDQFETKILNGSSAPSARPVPTVGSVGGLNTTFKRQITKQVEIIYLMSEDGPLVEFLSVESRVRGKDLPDSPDETEEGDFNHNLLGKYVGKENYKLLRKYAEKNKLSWFKKQDLLAIMDHYSKIK